MSTTLPLSSGYLGMVPNKSVNAIEVIDNTPHRIHNVTVHTFTVGDVDDPDLYASEPLWAWENSDAGLWITEHAVETPKWHRQNDYLTYGIKYVITAKLKEQDYGIWILKYKD